MEQYSLKRMSSEQWEDYKEIRLEALRTEPSKFGSNYAKEASYSNADWCSLLENENRAIFGLYHFDSLIGLTGVALFNGDPSKAIFFSSFVQPHHRGRGLSALFYKERINWAKQKGCASILVSHREGNDVSRAANQRFGFEFTHAEDVLWPDAIRAKELMYALNI